MPPYRHGGRSTKKNGIYDALEAFIKEVGLPGKFSEMNIPADTDWRAIADSTVLTHGCCKRLTPDEIYEILINVNEEENV